MTPSTASSSRSRIAAGSFTVQTCTGRPAMSGPDEPGRNDPESTDPDRHLDAVGALPRHPATQRCGARYGDCTRPHRRARTTAAERPDPSQAPIRERPQVHAIPGIETVEQRDERLDARVVLGVDVHARIRPAQEQRLEPRHAYTAAAEREAAAAVRREGEARVGGLDLGDRQRGDRARPVGEPVQAGVVEGHDDAVARDVRVRLEEAVSHGHGHAERLDRVLWSLLRAAPVSDRHRRRHVEERMPSLIHAGRNPCTSASAVSPPARTWRSCREPAGRPPPASPCRAGRWSSARSA